jgi:diguanylate cyclase (GGDEF)-like protein
VIESGDERAVAAATDTLAALNAQAADLRDHLATLRRHLAGVQHDLRAARASELQEANEKLVLAVLQADRIAETAVSNLSQLTRASQRDPLTDTPNRALMRDRLDTAITAAHRHGSHLAVLFLDLDHFKRINDQLGHANGDLVLQLVAQRLITAVRKSDTVSRHGGDEFLILLPQMSHVADAALIAAKLLAAVAAPARVERHVLQLSASIGVAIYPQDGADAAVLMERADAAMYRSKRRAHGGFAFHADAASGELASLSENHEWQRALARHDFAGAGRESVHHDLRRANEQLVLAALGAHAAAAQATEAHRQQIRFMAMVAHELRNPLTPIRLAAGMLADGERPGRRPLASLLGIIETQVAHMARLIDDLLDGSRISTGKLRLECSQADLQEILALAVETCRPLMEAKQQQLILALPAGPVRLRGDRVRLAQIVSNLLDNASKYSGENGTVTLAMAVQDQTVAITVSDNGVGIAPEVLPTIFDMFVQDARDSERSNGGLGIGLAVVRDLVQAHGGTVVATSAGKNFGSQFVVALPLAGPVIAEF